MSLFTRNQGWVYSSPFFEEKAMYTIWVNYNGRLQSVEVSNMDLAKLIWDKLAEEAAKRDNGTIAMRTARP